MKQNITAGIVDEGLVGEMRANFISSALIRRRIRELISNKEASATTGSLASAGYESPNWAFKQADTVGYIRALREISSLLED